ncbi:hypothetical protein AB3662_32435 [Sorangium cellulosum]|uniref:hypothetical protein n=1 Tax=Sorangium cellulosum TaxID=56 RepID=UPI003D9A6DE7
MLSGFSSLPFERITRIADFEERSAVERIRQDGIGASPLANSRDRFSSYCGLARGPLSRP